MTAPDPTFAEALEYADAEHLARQVSAWLDLSACQVSRTLRIAGGVAALTRPVFGRKLNHVSGAGMHGPVSDAEFAMLESCYDSRRIPLEIDVCPVAHPSLSSCLDKRGYLVNAFSNTYAMDMGQAPRRYEPVTGIRVVDCRQEDPQDFIDCSTGGFCKQGADKPAVLVETLARIALRRADTMLFSAKVYGRSAGTAVLSLIDTAWGRVGLLHLASTLAEFRGQGVQLALLHARIDAAREAGCQYTSIAAKPSHSGARNAEKAGFKLAYTRATFARALEE